MQKPAESFAVGAIDFTGGSLGKLYCEISELPHPPHINGLVRNVFLDYK